MTTTDPVTADMLAEALREAQAIIILARLDAGLGIVSDQGEQYVDVHAARDRWQGILDSYDAQRRDRLERLIGKELEQLKIDMEEARKWRDHGQVEWSQHNVQEARETNRCILALRLQLRELERHTDGTH